MQKQWVDGRSAVVVAVGIAVVIVLIILSVVTRILISVLVAVIHKSTFLSGIFPTTFYHIIVNFSSISPENLPFRRAVW